MLGPRVQKVQTLRIQSPSFILCSYFALHTLNLASASLAVRIEYFRGFETLSEPVCPVKLIKVKKSKEQIKYQWLPEHRSLSSPAARRLGAAGEGPAEPDAASCALRPHRHRGARQGRGVQAGRAERDGHQRLRVDQPAQVLSLSFCTFFSIILPLTHSLLPSDITGPGRTCTSAP